MPMQRSTTSITISQLKDDLREKTKGVTYEDLSLDDVGFHLGDADPHFTISGKDIPASDGGLSVWADYFRIPIPYFNRVGETFGVGSQGEILQQWVQATRGAIRVGFNDARILSVHSPSQQTIEPLQLVDVAERVLGTTDAEVVRLIDQPSEFAFDVHVPTGYDQGIGGDLKVGDITAGGVSFTHNRKLNHAPSVETYLYRLECTNGMRSRDAGLKVDARGQSLEEVLAELEAAAELAFSRVERQIQHFYNLREERVENPERALRAFARDYGIPQRSLDALETLAASEELVDEPTQFDLVNLITNFANDPRIRNDGGRLALERVGGAVILSAEPRCGHCRSRTDH